MDPDSLDGLSTPVANRLDGSWFHCWCVPEQSKGTLKPALGWRQVGDDQEYLVPSLHYRGSPRRPSLKVRSGGHAGSG